MKKSPRKNGVLQRPRMPRTDAPGATALCWMKFPAPYRANRRIARKTKVVATRPSNVATAMSLGHWTTQAAMEHTVPVHGLHPGGSDWSSTFHVANPTAAPDARAIRPAKAALTRRM
jgi:hypothetical protein